MVETLIPSRYAAYRKSIFRESYCLFILFYFKFLNFKFQLSSLVMLGTFIFAITHFHDVRNYEAL